MIEELLMPFVELLSNKNVVLIDKLVNELFLSLPKNTVLSKNVNFPRFAPVLYRKVNNAATPETKEIIDVGFKEFAKLVGVPYKIVNVVTGMKRVVEEKIVGAADTVDSATEAPKSKKLKTATPIAFSNQNEVAEFDDPKSKSKSKSKLVKNTATHSVMELDNTDEIVNSSKKSTAGSQPDKAHIRKAVDLKSTNDIEKKKVTSDGTVVQKAKENIKGGDSDKSAKSKKKRANEKPESKLSKEVGKEVETTINEDKKVSNTSKLEPSQRMDKSQGSRKKPQNDLKRAPKIEIQASDNDTKKAVPKLEDDDGSSNSWEDDRRVSWSSKLRVKSFRKTSTLSVDQVSLDAKPKKSVLKPFGKLYIKSSKSGAKAKKRNKN
jgi:SH3-like domain-containing protein